MLPGTEPNDDVMNTPCPQCNPWAKNRRAVEIFRPTPESDEVLRIAWEGPGHEVRFGIMAKKMRSLERERDAARRDLERADDSLPNETSAGTDASAPRS